MRIRERDENGELGEFKKIDPESKTKDEIIGELTQEVVFLRERDSKMQDDITAIIEGLTGGV